MWYRLKFDRVHYLEVLRYQWKLTEAGYEAVTVASSTGWHDIAVNSASSYDETVLSLRVPCDEIQVFPTYEQLISDGDRLLVINININIE